jgi:predicted GTPase
MLGLPAQMSAAATMSLYETGLRAALDRLVEIARTLGVSAAEEEARNVSARLAEHRFFLACLGQFKRGKSSLLNALVGRSVLPVGVPPVTSALTVLRYGSPARAQARFGDGASRSIGLDEVGSFVDERHNPENAKGVLAVEVFLPAPLLESGLCLVDTPGLGSVFAGNTAVTHSFVPQVDAALVVLGSDPPITGEEADLLVQVGSDVRHLLVVLNKADRATETELLEARRFTQYVIERRLGRPVDAILEVSARERLETGRATREWSALEQALSDLARQSRAEILASAGERATKRVRTTLLAEIDEREAALRRPLQATEARVRRLREAASATERLLSDLGPLFTATEADLSRRYEARREAFVGQMLPEALTELDRAIAAAAASNASLRALALTQAASIVERRVQDFLAEAEPFGEKLYCQATERLVSATNSLLAELLAEEGEADPPLGVQPGFQKRRGFFFTHMMFRTHVGLWSWLADVLHIRLVPRARRHAAEYLRELVYANTVRIVNDLRDRVLESRRSLEHEVARRLDEAVAAGERALTTARERHASGSAAVASEVARLAELRRALSGAGV